MNLSKSTRLPIKAGDRSAENIKAVTGNVAENTVFLITKHSQ